MNRIQLLLILLFTTVFLSQANSTVTDASNTHLERLIVLDFSTPRLPNSPYLASTFSIYPGRSKLLY